MAIATTTCYAASCDFCGRDFASSGDFDSQHYQSEEEATNYALDCDWAILVAGLHFVGDKDKLACDGCREKVEHTHIYDSSSDECEVCWQERPAGEGA